MTEEEQIIEEAKKAEELHKFSQHASFPVFEKLFLESLDLIRNVANIEKDFEIECRSRKIAVLFLEGILNSLKGAKDSLEFYNSQLEKIKRSKNQKS